MKEKRKHTKKTNSSEDNTKKLTKINVEKRAEEEEEGKNTPTVTASHSPQFLHFWKKKHKQNEQEKEATTHTLHKFFV